MRGHDSVTRLHLLAISTAMGSMVCAYVRSSKLCTVVSSSTADVIIGAPYAGLARRGAIYVLNGAANGAREKCSQVIFAEEVDDRLRAFGFSVSGGRDVDN